MNRKDSLLANYYYNKLPKVSKKTMGGKALEKYQSKGQVTPPSFLSTNLSIPTRAIQDNTYRAPLINVMEIDAANKKRQQQAIINQALKNQAYIKQGHTETAQEKEYRVEQLRKKAQENSDLAQTFGMFTPMGSNAEAGAIGANDFVNMSPGIGIIPASSRLASFVNSQQFGNQQDNAYFSGDNSFGENALGTLGLLGDIGMLGMGLPKMKPIGGVKLNSLNPLEGKRYYELQMPEGSSSEATPGLFDNIVHTAPPVAVKETKSPITFTPDTDWFTNAVKSNNIHGINASDLVQGRELGHDIAGNTGGFNKGVYDLQRFPGYVIKFEDADAISRAIQFPGYKDYNFVKSTENINHPNIAKVHRQFTIADDLLDAEGKNRKGQTALIMNKVTGTPVSKLSPAQLRKLPPEAIEELYNSLKTLRNNKLAFDFKGDNLVYDPVKKQFGMYDIESNFVPADNTGFDFWNKNVLGGSNLDIYGVDESGKNLKNALQMKLSNNYDKSANKLFSDWSESLANRSNINSSNPNRQKAFEAITNQGKLQLTDKIQNILSGIHHFQRGGMFQDYFNKYKNGGLTRYQKAGEVTDEEQLASAKKEGTEWLQNWYNSPMYKQMYAEQVSPGEEWITEGRQNQMNNLNNVGWNVDNKTKDAAAYITNRKGKYNISLNLKNLDPNLNASYAINHELTHYLNGEGTLVPQKILDFITSAQPKGESGKVDATSWKYTPFYQNEVAPYLKTKSVFGISTPSNYEEIENRLIDRNKTEDFWPNKNYVNQKHIPEIIHNFYDEFNYFNHQPNKQNSTTENISAWNDVRNEAQRLGIYNPLTEKFTMDHYNKFLEKGNSRNSERFRALRKWYTPEKIVEGLNKVVKNDSEQSSDMAEYGGQQRLDKYQIRGEVHSTCKDGYGCHGNSSTMTGDGIFKPGVRRQPSDEGSGGYVNYAGFNSPITWEQLVNYNAPNLAGLNKKEIKAEIKKYESYKANAAARAASLQSTFPGVTQNQVLAAMGDSDRINKKMFSPLDGKSLLPVWDAETIPFDTEWYPFYRSLMNQPTRVTAEQVLKYQSQKPNGIAGYEQTVQGNYGRKKAAYGGPLVDYYQGKMTGPNMFEQGGVSSNKGYYNYNYGVPHFDEGGSACYDAQGNVIPCPGQTFNTTDSTRHLAGQMMDFERTKGSPTGGPLSNFGYHASQLPYNQVSPNWQAPQNKQQAVDLFMQEIGKNPILENFSTAMEKGEAGDFLYNTGRDPRVYMLDQYLKSVGQSGLVNRGTYNVDTKTPQWTPQLQNSLNSQWNQYGPLINKLPINERRILLNKGRDFYYQNTYSGNPGDKNDGVTNWGFNPDGTPKRGEDGSLSPAYSKTWKPRIWGSVNTYHKYGGTY